MFVLPTAPSSQTFGPAVWVGLCHASYRSRKLSGSWCLCVGQPWAALCSLAGHLLPQKLVGIFSFQKLLCVATGTWHLRNVDDLSTCCPLTQAGSAHHHPTCQSPHFTLLNKWDTLKITKLPFSFRLWKVQTLAWSDWGWSKTMWTTWKAQRLWQGKCKLEAPSLASGETGRRHISGLRRI